MSLDPVKIAQAKIAFHKSEIIKLEQFLKMAESLLHEGDPFVLRHDGSSDSSVANDGWATLSPPPTSLWEWPIDHKNPLGSQLENNIQNTMIQNSIAASRIAAEAIKSAEENTSSPTDVILTEAANVLREYGEPMTAADIHDRVVRRGVKIGGKNPKGNLTAKFALKRDVFVLDKDNILWSLAEWPKGKGAFE